MQNNEISCEDKALYVIIAIIVVIVLCVKYCVTSKDDTVNSKDKNPSDVTSNTAFSECVSLKRLDKFTLEWNYYYLVKNTDDCINKLHDISIQLAKSINHYYNIDYYSDERVYNKSWEHYDDAESYQIHRKWLKIGWA